MLFGTANTPPDRSGRVAANHPATNPPSGKTQLRGARGFQPAAERRPLSALGTLLVLLCFGCGSGERPEEPEAPAGEWEVIEWGHPDQAEALTSMAPKNTDARSTASPPTIVLMISDDQHYRDFGFGENPAAVTPRLDRMAREGALFPVAHVGMSRCRPSLACLLAGTYPHQNGVYYNFAEPDLNPTLDTLPRQLGRSGYACWAGGKYWEGDPRRLGFSHHRGGHPTPFVREGQASVVEFLDATRGQPVFLWWAPRMPHIPHDPPDRLVQQIDAEKIEQPPYVPDEHWPEWRKRKRLVLAMGAWLDEGVGELFDILEDFGRLDNTLVVFLVDNGYEPRARAKGTVYERGFRTPVILWEPRRIEGGATLDHLISSLDVLPTILEWAGAKIPPHFEGRSLWPLLENPQAEWRGRLFGADYPRAASSKHHPDAARDVQALYVRTRRWKYVAFVHDVPKDTDAGRDYHQPWSWNEEIRAGDEMLFDLENDPDELNDLADDPAYADAVRTYRGQVFAWWTETGGGPLSIGPKDF